VPKRKLLRLPDYCDRGAEELCRFLSTHFKAKCILPKYSRMLINLNKPVNDKKLINYYCFGTLIPGNKNISSKEKRHRIADYYNPYHNKLAKEVQRIKKIKSYYICVHTFFHIVNGIERKPDIGLLFKYKKDAGLCNQIKKALLDNSGYDVGVNQPFSAFRTAAYSMNKYGKSKNISCVEFEINDKHLRNTKSVRNMGKLLCIALEAAI